MGHELDRPPAPGGTLLMQNRSVQSSEMFIVDLSNGGFGCERR